MTSLGSGNYSLIIISGLIVASAVFVFWKNPKSPLHRAFFAFALGGAVWTAGIGLISLTHNFFFDKVVNYGGLLFVLGFFLVAKAIPVPMRFAINPFFLYAPIAIDALYVVPLGLINSGMTISANGTLASVPGPYIISHALITISYTLFGIAVLVHKMCHTKDGEEQVRIRYLFFGTALFMTSSVLFDAVLPAMGISDFNLLGPLSAVAFVGIIAYAIVRHRLLDIRIVIQRGLIYTILLVLIAATYVCFITILGFFMSATGQLAALLTGVITTVAGIFGVPAIDRYLRRVTDKIFFKDRYDYAEALHRLSAVVHTLVEFDELVNRIERTLQEILKSESVRLIFNDYQGKDRERSQAYMSTVSVPIALEGATLGSIVCRKKLSGEYYTPKDITLLETFSYQAATALGRARLQREVKEYASKLESKVLERTEALHHAQENQKQMMIDISHNLQTPLAVFQTKMEQLKRAIPDDQGVAGFDTLLGNLSAFIYNLLTLARLERAPNQNNAVRIDMSAMVREIVDEIGIIAADKHVDVSSNLVPDLAISGSVKEIREAILNIMSNAVKYLKPLDAGGERKIVVSLVRKGASALLSVTDTGIGIAAGDCERLFERFYRVNKSGNPLGTGLGLAIARQIFLNHKGSIRCESVEGIGTTFYIELPLI